ncbi:MAG: KpsF/GutQ family sugar-phosphate isomerase [Calditrichaeota bacterium]|nr:KpsF/GutQ family sugar-phosphate isomerase [Calditrichota bacterium]
MRVPTNTSKPGGSIELARRLFAAEIEALETVVTRLDLEFDRAVKFLLDCRGKIIVTGLGKSGIAAQKIAATLASTGAPALFLHSAEAVHGDMGVVAGGDCVIAISYSGETREVIGVLPHLKLLDVPVIALTGQPASTLAVHADIHIDISVPHKEWPFGLIPTASHVVTVAVGDALAVALLVKRGIREEDFANLHPGGLLGRKLLVSVGELMHTGDRLPLVSETDEVRVALTEMTSKMLGVTCVVDAAGRLSGIITDGDLRRLLERSDNPLSLPASEAMTRSPKYVTPDSIAASALRVMEQHAITSLPVLNGNQELVGLIHMHDIVRLETLH